MKNMKDVKNKEMWTITRRGFLIWWKILPDFFIVSALRILVQSGFPFVTIYLTAQLLNEIAGERSIERIWGWVLPILLIGAVQALVGSWLGKWEFIAAWNKGIRKLADLFTDKHMALDFRDLESPAARDLYSQIEGNWQYMGWGLERVMYQYVNMLGAIVRIVGAIALSVTLFLSKVPEDSFLSLLNHPALSFLLVLSVLILTIIGPILNTHANSYWVSAAEEMKFANRQGDFYGYQMRSSRERALDIRNYRQDIIADRKLEQFQTAFRTCSLVRAMRGTAGFCIAGSSMISHVLTGLIYLYVCLKAWGGAFGVGNVTQYVSAITSLSDGVSILISTLGQIRNNVPFLKTVYEFLDIPNNMYQGSLSVEKRDDRKYEVEFRDVSFRYPFMDTYALEHVSIKFVIGERIAVVGQNGSGKTTMIKLLCRLYDPTEGEILLNGIDIRKYNYREYMDIFSVVFQDFQLTAFSLGENVAGCRNYEKERVLRSLEDAGFGERLRSMPNGLDTCIYKNFDKEGVEVSGGEAQKIAIARALYKNAPFIIMDEPTAALDPIAEAEVYESFDQLIQDKTAIYISHRLSSCKFCDRILVFDRGHVVQFGTHEELIAQGDGKYHELWTAQAKYYS